LNAVKNNGFFITHVIHILLKDHSEKTINLLKKCLSPYKLSIFASNDNMEVKVYCQSESVNYEQVLNVISQSIEYDNLQVKKERKNSILIIWGFFPHVQYWFYYLYKAIYCSSIHQSNNIFTKANHHITIFPSRKIKTKVERRSQQRG
jgi:hypothetical protein